MMLVTWQKLQRLKKLLQRLAIEQERLRIQSSFRTAQEQPRQEGAASSTETSATSI